MKKKNSILIYPLLIMGLVLFLTYSCKKKDNTPTPDPTPTTVTDIDGNVYNTVKIGTQTWMKENLKVTHYRNGIGIPVVTDGPTWAGLSTGAYCDYNNTPSNSIIYGKLYNWYSINDSRNIAPIGWHVPTDAEWTALDNYLGGTSVADKLKETGTSHWSSPNTGATNESGFTALPGGTRHSDGTFNDIRDYGHWWSSTEYGPSVAWGREMNYNSSIFSSNFYYSKDAGFSVRCIKD